MCDLEPSHTGVTGMGYYSFILHYCFHLFKGNDVLYLPRLLEEQVQMLVRTLRFRSTVYVCEATICVY